MEKTEKLDENITNISKEVGIVMSIANTLRGPYKADKYKDVIIPMLIIRRIECALEKTKNDVVAKYKGNPKTPVKILERISGYRFYNTCEYNLLELTKDPLNAVSNFKFYIDSFSVNIQTILKNLSFQDEIDKMSKNNRLIGVLKKFSALDLYPDHVSNIKMGYIFEEILRRFSAKAGEAGDHYTPREVVRLLVKLMTAEGCTDILEDGKTITVLDMACGTGGMLSTTYDEITNERYGINPNATVELFGQENNPESFAICQADMLIKGQNADHICFADTMKTDCFPNQDMRFVIANPPFGQAWGGDDAGDGVEKAVKEEFSKPHSRFVAGLPAKGDMQLLFMQHAIYKMKPKVGRAAIITNGSPLFSGGTTSGESQIRRYMLEHDLVEAIVALPGDLFYNTSISIYVFVLSKNKKAERKNKVQLINATGQKFWHTMKKSLGNKRKEILPEQIEAIVSIYKNYDRYVEHPDDECKVFPTSEFLYKEWTVYQPLQRSGSLSMENIERLESSDLFNSNSRIFDMARFEELEEMDPRSAKDEKDYQKLLDGKRFVENIIGELKKHSNTTVFNDYKAFTEKVKSIIKGIEGYSDSRLDAICMELSHMDKSAIVQRDKKHKTIYDPTTKDTEIVKLSENVDNYFKREVYPHIPDAHYVYEYDPSKKGSKEKIGAEFPFTKYFYKYEKPEDSDTLLKQFLSLESEISSMIKDL